MKILVINGPNLGLLGKREPEIYGNVTLSGINAMLKKRSVALKIKLEVHQSNDEGAIVSMIGAAVGKHDGIIINPAAYTHTSIAIRDAILAVGIPCVEVHLSNIHAREDFRQKSITAGACIAQISGFGADSYLLALDGLVSHLKKKAKKK